MNVKRITLNVNDGTKKGTKIAFEPKCDAYVSEHRGIKTVELYSMIPQMMYNGREVLIILSAPPDIMEILKPIIDSTVKGLING